MVFSTLELFMKPASRFSAVRVIMRETRVVSSPLRTLAEYFPLLLLLHYYAVFKVDNLRCPLENFRASEEKSEMFFFKKLKGEI